MKTYTIRETHPYGRTYDYTGTLPELTRKFAYTLSKGKAWEGRAHAHKINLAPRTGKSLVDNLQYAADNAAADGYSGITYTLI